MTEVQATLADADRTHFQTDRPDVFISYSRKDRDFVQERLCRALVAKGKDLWIDLEDVPPAADWKSKVQEGIDSAKAFVFVLSPDSLASRICAEELERAVETHKRLIPVLYRAVSVERVPAELEAPNWVYLGDQADFDGQLERLLDALDTDLEWRDMHARLVARAHEWTREDRDRSFLLRGRDLVAAEHWLAGQGSHKETATPLQTEYIVASRRAATRRQRVTIAAVLTALSVAIALAIVAWNQRNTAISATHTAESRQLAAQASASVNSDPHLSSLLALEAHQVAPTEEATIAALDIVHHQLAGVVRAGNWVWSVAVAPGGNLVAAGLDNGTIRLWDLRTRRPVGPPLLGHTGPVNSVAFSADGKMLASGSDDSTVRLWNVATHKEMVGSPLPGHGTYVKAVAFSPDGKRVVSGGFDSKVRIWSVTKRREVGEPLSGHAAAVQSVAFSPDGRTVASGSNDWTVRLWNARTHTSRVLGSCGDLALSVAFSTDGRRLAAACGNGTVRLWDVEGHRQLRPPLRVGAVPNSVAFNPEGTALASGSEDNVTRLWDTTTSNTIGPRLTDPGDATLASGIQSVTFARRGALLVAGNADGHILLWNVLQRRLSAPDASSPTPSASTIAFSPKGPLLVSGAQALQLWNTRTGRTVGRPLMRYPEGHAMGQSTTINGVAFSQNGKLVASVSEGRKSELRIYDVHRRKLVSPPVPASTATAVAFAPDGKTVAFTSNSVIRLWDLAAHRFLQPALRGHQGIVRAIAIAPDGGLLASGGDDHTVRLWSLRTHRQVAPPLRGHADVVSSVAFSEDGRTLASGSWDKTARLWDVAARRQIGGPFTGNTALISSVALSPNGSTLASQSEDGKILLWDVATHLALARPIVTSEGITSSTSVAFARDGTVLASSGDGAPILWSSRLWNTNPATLERELCPLVDPHAEQTLNRIAPNVSYRPICVGGS